MINDVLWNEYRDSDVSSDVIYQLTQQQQQHNENEIILQWRNEYLYGIISGNMSEIVKEMIEKTCKRGESCEK